MRKNKHKKKAEHTESFFASLARDYDIPPELLHGGCFIEIRGRNSVAVRGCKRIIKYSNEKIVLRMSRYSITVTGKKLTCLTYFSGAISVEGIIDSLNFGIGEENQNEE